MKHGIKTLKQIMSFLRGEKRKKLTFEIEISLFVLFWLLILFEHGTLPELFFIGQTS